MQIPDAIPMQISMQKTMQSNSLTDKTDMVNCDKSGTVALIRQS